MPSAREWFQKYQEALRKGDRAAAAEYFRRYQEAKKAEGRGGSRPTIVRLKTGPGWHAVPIDKIPEKTEEDPEFFEDTKKIFGGEE